MLTHLLPKACCLDVWLSDAAVDKQLHSAGVVVAEGCLCEIRYAVSEQVWRHIANLQT
jgi:hypothetical protein